MKHSGKAVLPLRWLIPVLIASPLLSPATAQTKGSAKYVVLQVSSVDGKVFHKAMADKEQDAYKKSLEEEYQKAKRTLQDEKKEFLKKHPGEKFEKPEPKKPSIRAVKRDIKTYSEAMKMANDLDREREREKNKKSGPGNGKSNAGGGGKDAEK